MKKKLEKIVLWIFYLIMIVLGGICYFQEKYLISIACSILAIISIFHLWNIRKEEKHDALHAVSETEDKK